MQDIHEHDGVGTTRRGLLRGMMLAGTAAGLGLWREPVWALAAPNQTGVLAGTEFDLSIGRTPVNFTGKPASAITVSVAMPR